MFYRLNIVKYFFLLFFAFFSLHANTVVLNSEYCIQDQNELDSLFFDTNKSVPSFIVTTIPSSRASYRISSLDIAKEFKERGYTIIDESSGVINFRRYCNLAGKRQEIASRLMERFREKYPCIKASLPHIEATSVLPRDFERYSIKELEVGEHIYKDSKGSFAAIFTTPSKKSQKLYFRFTLEASLDLFKAKYNLHNDKILTDNDYEKIHVELNRLSSDVIACTMPQNLITKSYISAGTILDMQRLEIKKDVLKGASIRAILSDGMLVIGIDALLLDEGNIGEEVTIKTDKGKILKAKLVSPNEAIILP